MIRRACSSPESRAQRRANGSRWGINRSYRTVREGAASVRVLKHRSDPRLSATARAQYRRTQLESTFLHVILRSLAHERFEARSLLRAQRVQLRLESRSEIESDAQIIFDRTAIENHRQALHLDIGEAANTNQPFERPRLRESESPGRIRGRRRRIEHGPRGVTQ